MKLRTKLGAGVLILVCCLVSYRLGVFVTVEAFKQGFKDTQAMLAFNHANSFRSIKECLDREQVDESRQLVDNLLISERELLAIHLRDGIGSKMIGYIELRSDETLDSLKGFESDRGSSWSVPRCK